MYLPEGHPDKAKEVGLEETPEAWCARLVEVFREVRRVLHPSGTLWLNVGDSYTSGDRATWRSGASENNGQDVQNDMARPRTPSGLKPKDMIGLPWLLAFALRSDGWWLRSEITWAKKSPMPESVTDRPTCATEKIFLLSKAERYFYDQEAVKEQSVCDHPSGNGYARPERLSHDGRGQAKGWTPEPGRDYETGQSRHGNALEEEAPRGSRNMRNFWLLGPENYPEAHFAAFPTEIPKRAILAGTSARGVCPQCLTPWQRVVEKTPEYAAISGKCVHDHEGDGLQYGMRQDGKGPLAGDATRKACPNGLYRTTGWAPGCTCEAGLPIPATVCDPFSGTFTTCAVALELGRSAIGIELNPAYIELGKRRLAKITPGFPSLA